jgi:hypothetical protein
MKNELRRMEWRVFKKAYTFKTGLNYSLENHYHVEEVFAFSFHDFLFDKLRISRL